MGLYYIDAYIGILWLADSLWNLRVKISATARVGLARLSYATPRSLFTSASVVFALSSAHCTPPARLLEFCSGAWRNGRR